MSEWPPLTRTLADFCARIDIRNLPESTVEHAKLCILDWISAALAGCRTQSTAIVGKVIGLFGGMPESTLVGQAVRVPAPFAALVNGTGSTALEIDDVLEEVPLHPGGAVIPAAFALAESVKAGGPVLIASVVAGYEAAGRTMMALGLSHYRFWHSTGTCGAIGAAASCGRVLNLGGKEFAGALGLGGAQASGLWEQVNRNAVWVKHFHGGKAGMAGVLSALLAREGLLGADSVVEGEKGLLPATSTSRPEDVRRALDSLGAKYIIEANLFKRYACCRACFEAMEGAKRILARNPFQPPDIESIELITRPSTAWLVGNPEPRDAFQAKFSVQFGTALILTGRSGGYEDYSAQTLQDLQILELMAKTTLRVDPHQEARGIRVNMKMKNGRSFTESIICPTLEPDEVRSKFRSISSKTLGEGVGSRLEKLVGGLEQLDNLEPVSGLLVQVKS